MRELWSDLKLGTRSLGSNWAVTAAAVFSLALGVGANTAIFSLVDAVLLKPPPVQAPDELVSIRTSSLDEQDPAGAPSLSYLELIDIASSQSVFGGVAGYVNGPHSLTGGEGPAERVWASTVTGNFFDVLGVPLALGTGFATQELNPSTARRVVVLSHPLWIRRFGTDQQTIGQTLEIDGERYTIVGVAATGFRGIDLEVGGWQGSSTLPELWKPLARSVPLPFGLDIDDRGSRILTTVARTTNAASLDQARAYVKTQSARLRQAFPDTNTNIQLEALALSQARLSPSNRPSVSRFLYVLVTVVVVVLAIACLNVAALLLVRASTRHRETAIRLALGAGRWRIVRQRMAEATAITTLGLLTSIPFSFWCLRLLNSVRLPFQVPLHVDARIDARTLAFAGAVALIANVAVGVASALRSARASSKDALQTRTRGPAFRARDAWRAPLIGSQVALSLILLMTAIVFSRTLVEAQSIDPGFDASRVIAMSVDLLTEGFRYDESMGTQFYRNALDRVGSLPAVESVSWAAGLPLVPSRLLIWFSPGEQQPASDADYIVSDCDIVGPDYFRTMGIPLLRGRDFSDPDNGDRPVVVINEVMARQFWPGQDALGKRFNVRGRAGVRRVQVIGIARTTQRQTLWDQPQPFLYLPVLQRHFPIMNLLVKVEGDPASMIDSVRSELGALDPALPIYDAKLVEEQIELALSQPRMAATLLGAASALAMLLAAVGVYGVTAYTVAQRTYELGIRCAVGAERKDILRLILRQGLTAATGGAVIGGVAAMLIARFAASSVQGARPIGSGYAAVCIVLVLLVVLAACYLPARRASELDPVSTLRWE